jgi:hypothetical protein
MMKKSFFALLAITFVLIASCGSNNSEDLINVENLDNGNAWEVEENSSDDTSHNISLNEETRRSDSSDVLEDSESGFANWVERLGVARQQKKCISLSQCLENPAANSLYSAEDKNLHVFADCADLPMILRAYYNYKTKQVFSYVNDIDGGRYTVGNTPSRFRNYTQFSNVKKLFVQIANSVHSGFYRTAPNVEKTDTYPVDISRATVRPGTVFYDPNGHVLVVYKVEDNGTVRMMDGHPDNSLTIKRFNESFAQGKPSNGGGFRAWRKYHMEGNREDNNLRIVRDLNRHSKGFNSEAQFKKRYSLSNGTSVKYHQWVRMKLSKSGSKLNPIKEFSERLEALCVDIDDRITAVNSAIKAGIANKSHPNTLPRNIYGTHGEWETWSSPSRDARLKASFAGLHQFVSDSIKDLHTNRSNIRYSGSSYTLIRKFKNKWNEITDKPECNFSYTNSRGSKVRLSFDTVLNRIWKLSFDPYHCPELRWGANMNSSEFSTCEDGNLKLSWYRNEQRLRNNIDRVYDAVTTIDFGPEHPIDVNINSLMRNYIDTIPKPDAEPQPQPDPQPIPDDIDVVRPPVPAPPVTNTSTCKVTARLPRHGGAPVYKAKIENWDNQFADAFTGDTVKVLLEDGSWVKISYRGMTGWMKRSHIGNCRN